MYMHIIYVHICIHALYIPVCILYMYMHTIYTNIGLLNFDKEYTSRVLENIVKGEPVCDVFVPRLIYSISKVNNPILYLLFFIW